MSRAWNLSTMSASIMKQWQWWGRVWTVYRLIGAYQVADTGEHGTADGGCQSKKWNHKGPHRQLEWALVESCNKKVLLMSSFGNILPRPLPENNYHHGTAHQNNNVHCWTSGLQQRKHIVDVRPWISDFLNKNMIGNHWLIGWHKLDEQVL